MRIVGLKGSDRNKADAVLEFARTTCPLTAGQCRIEISPGFTVEDGSETGTWRISELVVKTPMLLRMRGTRMTKESRYTMMVREAPEPVLHYEIYRIEETPLRPW